MPLTVRGDKRGQWRSSSVSPVCSHSARTSGRNDALPAYTHTHTHTHMYIHIDERYMSMLTLQCTDTHRVPHKWISSACSPRKA